MVSKELQDQIRAGKVKPTEEELTAMKEADEKELTELFAPFSEWIARGAMSHSKAFPDMKEVSYHISKACRTIMKIARTENKIPTECIDRGCKATDVEVSDLMDALDELKIKVAEEEWKGKKTTIQVTAGTLEELRRKKLVESETWESVIQRLIRDSDAFEKMSI